MRSVRSGGDLKNFFAYHSPQTFRMREAMFSLALTLAGITCPSYSDRHEVATDKPLSLGNATQLLVDDYIIQRRDGLVRRTQPAKKMQQPVLRSRYPWETEPGPDVPGKRVLAYGTVLSDPLHGKYRMWYMGRMGSGHGCEIPELEIPGENVHCDLTMYAESQNGIDWHRPSLGLVRFNGELQNNIVADFHGVSVLLDKQEPDPSKRYKAIGFVRRFHEIRVAYSPDGIHWTEPEHATNRVNEGALNVCYVPHLDCYVAGSIELSTDSHHEYIDADGDRQGKRVAVALRTDGKNLKEWSHKTYLNPDGQDPANAQFYGMTPFSYGENGIVFAFLHVFHVVDPGARAHDGPIDAQLVYSRDGETWHRLDDRQPIIPRGPSGSFDGGMIMMTASGAFVRDDELVAYYTACEGEHVRQNPMTIARASWPVDRLVALEAGETEAVLETKLLTAPNGRLTINADARGGYVVVEVLNANGEVLPGFSAKDCEPVVGDHLRHQVHWPGRNLSDVVHPIRLRLLIRDAKLFSFRLAKGA